MHIELVCCLACLLADCGDHKLSCKQLRGLYGLVDTLRKGRLCGRCIGAAMLVWQWQCSVFRRDSSQPAGRTPHLLDVGAEVGRAHCIILAGKATQLPPHRSVAAAQDAAARQALPGCLHMKSSDSLPGIGCMHTSNVRLKNLLQVWLCRHVLGGSDLNASAGANRQHAAISISRSSQIRGRYNAQGSSCRKGLSECTWRSCQKCHPTSCWPTHAQVSNGCMTQLLQLIRPSATNQKEGRGAAACLQDAKEFTAGTYRLCC